MSGNGSTRGDADEADWSLIIHPAPSLLDLRLGELWGCRDLIGLFVWRDFVAFYKQTLLGPLWHILQPLLTTLTFTLVFGRLAQLPTDGAPPLLFYMTGNVLWTYFSTTLTKTGTTFVGNAHLYGKVYFHRLAIPVSVALSNLIALAIQAVMLAGFIGFYALRGEKVSPNVSLLVLPWLVVLLAGFSLGFGILISAVTTRYRDLVHVIGFGAQLWMYATPVIYPLSTIPDKYRWVALLNPLSPVFEVARHALLGVGSLRLGDLLYSSLAMVAVLAVGMVLFNRVERNFMDTV